jgi:hypothetical protein
MTKAFQGREYKFNDNIPRLILTAIKAGYDSAKQAPSHKLSGPSNPSNHYGKQGRDFASSKREKRQMIQGYVPEHAPKGT